MARRALDGRVMVVQIHPPLPFMGHSLEVRHSLWERGHGGSNPSAPTIRTVRSKAGRQFYTLFMGVRVPHRLPMPY
jgi:hypothetical protein